MNIQSWLIESTQLLNNAGVETARLDSLILLEHILQKSREWILGHTEHKLLSKQLYKLSNVRALRASHLPLAYIIGSKEFYGRDFFVTHDTLIPRPESEAIIDLLKTVQSLTNINTIIDVGTGSGCLLITAGLETPNTHLIGLDIGIATLKVARKNARVHNIAARFVQSDLLLAAPTMPKTRQYVIIANLPYVPTATNVSKEVLTEPAIAIFSGTDGLNCMRQFWGQVADLKHKPRAIITESLTDQHTSITELSEAAGFKLRQTSDLAQLFVPN